MSDCDLTNSLLSSERKYEPGSVCIFEKYTCAARQLRQIHSNIYPAFMTPSVTQGSSQV